MLTTVNKRLSKISCKGCQKNNLCNVKGCDALAQDQVTYKRVSRDKTKTAFNCVMFENNQESGYHLCKTCANRMTRTHDSFTSDTLRLKNGTSLTCFSMRDKVFQVQDIETSQVIEYDTTNLIATVRIGREVHGEMVWENAECENILSYTVRLLVAVKNTGTRKVYVRYSKGKLKQSLYRAVQNTSVVVKMDGVVLPMVRTVFECKELDTGKLLRVHARDKDLCIDNCTLTQSAHSKSTVKSSSLSYVCVVKRPSEYANVLESKGASFAFKDVQTLSPVREYIYYGSYRAMKYIKIQLASIRLITAMF